jgi:murein L,D-transpeptidase YcbB/YkuD
MPNKHVSTCSIIRTLSVLISLLVVANQAVCAQERLEFDKSKLPVDGPTFPAQVLKSAEILKAFYKKSDMQSIWLGTDRMPQLISRMRLAKLDGLNPRDYPINKLEKLHGALGDVVDKQSRAIIEAWFSAYFLQYASDIKLGRFKPRKIDPELHWKKKVVDEFQVLEGLSKAKSIDAFFNGWQTQNPAYLALKRILSQYYAIEKSGGWPAVSDGEVLKPGMTSSRVIEVRARLAVTDNPTSLAENNKPEEYSSDLLEAVKAFQERHGLEKDGVIGKTTLMEMNVSVTQRIRQLVVSMERWRWMPEDYGTHFIGVNIARYKLLYVRDMRIEDEMRVVVGKPYHRTPVFSSEIKFLVLNPYWNVPRSIATKEMLPKLKANPGSVSARGFEARQNGRSIALTSIDWSQYSRQSFPFKLRQKPGPKNALGRIKFMFPNQFNVYLHDTPARTKFESASRAFSHGCVRVYRPIDLAVRVLSQMPGWDRARIQAVLASGKTTTVNLPKPLKVHIVYSTAWIGTDNKVHFGKDIYKRDKKLYRILYNQ